MRLGEIMDFIRIYGFVKQSKVLIDRKKKCWFNSEGTIYLPIFWKARPFFFTVLQMTVFFLSIYIYIAD